MVGLGSIRRRPLRDRSWQHTSLDQSNLGSRRRSRPFPRTPEAKAYLSHDVAGRRVNLSCDFCLTWFQRTRYDTIHFLWVRIDSYCLELKLFRCETVRFTASMAAHCDGFDFSPAPEQQARPARIELTTLFRAEHRCETNTPGSPGKELSAYYHVERKTDCEEMQLEKGVEHRFASVIGNFCSVRCDTIPPQYDSVTVRYGSVETTMSNGSAQAYLALAIIDLGTFTFLGILALRVFHIWVLSSVSFRLRCFYYLQTPRGCCCLQGLDDSFLMIFIADPDSLSKDGFSRFLRLERGKRSRSQWPPLVTPGQQQTCL